MGRFSVEKQEFLLKLVILSVAAILCKFLKIMKQVKVSRVINTIKVVVVFALSQNLSRISQTVLISDQVNLLNSKFTVDL